MKGYSRQLVTEQQEYLRDLLDMQRAAGREVTQGEIALGVVVLSRRQPEQAKVLAYMWWGLDVEALRQLLLLGRHDTIQALWREKPPSYRELGRYYGVSHVAISKTVERGRRTLLARLVQTCRNNA